MQADCGTTTQGSDRERGATLALISLAIVSLVGMMAFVLDVGQLFWVRRDLQNAADAGALAAVYEIGSGNVTSTAQSFAAANHTGHGQIVAPTDVVVGSWNPATRTFTAGGTPNNAVQVTARRSSAAGNQVDLSFGPLLGLDESDVAATGVAWRPPGSGGTRFLIDDEMLDEDVKSSNDGDPVLEELCNNPPPGYPTGGVTCPETKWLINDDDHGDGSSPEPSPDDAFIQLNNYYVGLVLELPTGQVGDEGLFDIEPGGCTFPFTGNPAAFSDFVFHNIDSNKDGVNPDFQEIMSNSQLDPLTCVQEVSDASAYPSYVNPNYIHVSPVYKSDVSALNDVGGEPAVNALGERRGLFAFSIIGVGSDPDGGGSQLPNLIIRVEAPPANYAVGGAADGRAILVE